MDDKLIALALAVVAMLTIAAHHALRNSSARTLKFALALLFGLSLIGLLAILAPPSVTASPLFGLAMIGIILLCMPLMRRRMRGHPKEAELLERMSARGKWKPSLWWVPVLLLLGPVWMVAGFMVLPTNSRFTPLIIVVPAIGLCGAAAVVATQRVILWWRALIFDRN